MCESRAGLPHSRRAIDLFPGPPCILQHKTSACERNIYKRNVVCVDEDQFFYYIVIAQFK